MTILSSNRPPLAGPERRVTIVPTALGLVAPSDPDGDPIIYKLEASPPGMSIGEQSGQIHWSVAPDTKGTFHVKVVAKDNRGGFAAQDFELSISAAAKAS